MDFSRTLFVASTTKKSVKVSPLETTSAIASIIAAMIALLDWLEVKP